MLKVSKVIAKDNYILFVELSDGRSGNFDVKPYLEKGVFTQLKDEDYFKQVRPFLCGIIWPDEQDLSADTIAYELVSPQSRDLREKIPVERSTSLLS